MKNAINWFEIPCKDLDRAERFYNTLLGTPLKRETFGGSPISIFPHEQASGIGGCLVSAREHKPSSDGVRVYLGVADLDAVLARAKAAGGELLVPRTSIGDQGFIGVVRDSEGNQVGLHLPPG
jgi:predicted enzyme related to lactoylglutathione lyase